MPRWATAGRWATRFAPCRLHMVPLWQDQQDVPSASGSERADWTRSLRSLFRNIASKSPALQKLRGPTGFPGNLPIIQNHNLGQGCGKPLVPAQALANSGVNLSAWVSSSANWGITTLQRGGTERIICDATLKRYIYAKYYNQPKSEAGIIHVFLQPQNPIWFHLF